MKLPPNTSQRDLVALAIVLCGDRPRRPRVAAGSD
jgi:hypothetical protein